MIWYANNTTHLDTLVIPTGSGHLYQTYNIENLIEIERHTIGNIPTMVRIDVPHNIAVQENPRWAISVRIKTKLKITDWKDFINFMEPFVDDNNY
jgi:hypothetical protein